jgi:DNA-binding XRE family transcriptional regulator
MDDVKIAKFKSDYDPECVLTLIRNQDGDIILDINKRMQPDGTGEFRITMSGGQISGREKLIVVSAFEKIIDVFNRHEDALKDRERIKSIDMGEINRSIGNKIKSFRKLRGLTQQELADKIGIDRCTVTCYESGKVSIPLQTLYMITDIFDLTIFDFLPEFSCDDVNFVQSLGQNTHNTI